MEVRALRVRKYRCIEDSGWVSIDNLTCLIGKNESGKTAFMKAVEQLNPSYPTGGYEPYRDYPRQEWTEYKQRHEDDPETVASARLTLTETEREAVESSYDTEMLDSNEVTVHRNYKNERNWELPFADGAVLAHLRETAEFENDTEAALADASTVDDLDSAVTETVTETVGGEPATVAANEIGEELLEAHLPEFRLVGETSIMDGRIDIDGILDRRDTGELDAGDQTFLSLLSVAGLDLAEFRDVDNWREKTTELETASATISADAMEYWSQSGDLQIRIQEATGEDERHLELRVENKTHNVSVEFERRSRGFRWFFSSFCQLSELREREGDIVLMLDEPGLNLHARAKQEFLNFMKESVATSHPVVYTTHSPFMIDQENLHRTKMVMAEPVGETNLFTDIALADDNTQFPLRNVFELDLMDTLLVNPQTLLVERKADHAYLYVLSRFVTAHGGDGLDSRWTVVPIKDEQNIASFIALFGEERLDVAALLETDPAGRRRPSRSEREATVEESVKTKLLDSYADVRGTATVEDIFSESFYLTLVNRAYASEIDAAGAVPDQLTADDIAGDAPIVERVSAYFTEHEIAGGEFDRSRPALYLQKNRAELEDELDKATRRSFGRLFRDLNNTLESFDSVESRSGSIFETLGFG